MRRFPFKTSTAVAMCVLFSLSLCWSDSLTLRDGRHIEGKYIGGSESVIGFVSNGAIQYFAVTDVMAVMFGDPGVNSPLGNMRPNSFRSQGKHGRMLLTKLREQRRSIAVRMQQKRRIRTLSMDEAARASSSSLIPAGDHMYRLLAASLVASSDGVLSPVR
jgi:hypothetical protein